MITTLSNSKYKTPISLGIALLITGVIFQIQHWPFSTEIRLSAFCIITLFYCLHFSSKKSKIFLDYIKVMLVFFWALQGILRTYHLPYYQEIGYISLSLVLIWGITEIIKYLSTSNPNKQKTNFASRSLFILPVIIIFLGATFKLLHWPGSSSLLTLGISLGGLWFILQVFRRKK